MTFIKKGDRVSVPDSPVPLVASRDEYNSRVFLMTEEDYKLHEMPGEHRGKEEPYLILPDRTLMRHYEHGFSDAKYDKN
jgi:hypothetical protein